jgi:hypothetical protein
VTTVTTRVNGSRLAYYPASAGLCREISMQHLYYSIALPSGYYSAALCSPTCDAYSLRYSGSLINCICNSGRSSTHPLPHLILTDNAHTYP